MGPTNTAKGLSRQNVASRPLNLDPMFLVRQHVADLHKTNVYPNNTHSTRDSGEQMMLVHDRGLAII